MSYNILKIDPYLEPHKNDIELRMKNYTAKRNELVGKGGDLCSFALGYKYFGIHPVGDGWVYREWAPAAQAMYLTGDFNGWDMYACPMQKLENGIFEVKLKGKNALKLGQKIQAIVIHDISQTGNIRRIRCRRLSLTE